MEEGQVLTREQPKPKDFANQSHTTHTTIAMNDDESEAENQFPSVNTHHSMTTESKMHNPLQIERKKRGGDIHKVAAAKVIIHIVGKVSVLFTAQGSQSTVDDERFGRLLNNSSAVRN